MAWDIRNLVRPIAPGLPGMLNPLAFIGAGMASDDPLASLQTMGNLQLGAQRQNQGLLALQQRQQLLAEQLAFRRQQEANRNAISLSKMLAPTAMQRNIDWAASLPEGDPRREMALASMSQPSTTVNITSGEATKAAQAESALAIGEELMALVESGSVDPEGIAGLWTKYREQPTVMAAIARFADDISADESRGVQLSEMLSQQLLQAMRGAQVGPLEEERFKASLPVFGKPNFKENLRTTLENIRQLENRRRSMRNLPPLEQSMGPAPKPSVGGGIPAGWTVTETTKR